MRNPLFQKTRYQAVLSGNILEFYAYEKPIFYDFKVDEPVSIGDAPEEQQKENRLRSRSRSRRMIRRIVYSNFGMWENDFGKPFFSKFLTLTFRDHVTDIKEGNKEFTLFIKRLNYALGTKLAAIQYLAVIEFQKSGRIHYHVMLFNLPYIHRYIDVFNQAWDRGFMLIKRVNNERHAANYITKYMSKEEDERLRGEKSYFCSRGLLRPVTLRNQIACMQVQKLLLSQQAFYKYDFENEHTGKTNCFWYDLGRNPKIKELVLASEQQTRLYSNQ